MSFTSSPFSFVAETVSRTVIYEKDCDANVKDSNVYSAVYPFSYLRRRRDYVPPDALSQTGSYSVRGERKFHKFGPPIYVEKAHVSVLVSEDACMGEKPFRGHHLTLSLTSFVILSLVK
jgi:hypothetical protein